MRIFSIDQSYTSTGWVLLDDGVMIECGRFVSNRELDIFDRAWEVTREMKRLVDLYNPNVIAIEGLAFAKVGNATRDLAGLQFTIVTYLRYVSGLRVEIIPPNTVKKVATGKGNAKKDLLVEALPIEVRAVFDAKNYRKTTGLTDLTDAYWIGKSAELV